MRTVLLLALAPIVVFASIDGTVVNGTTGKPQGQVSVTLLKPGAQGMQRLANVMTDGAGQFRFENDQPGGGPQLLQASYRDVTYNKLLTPNIPTSGVQLEIFEDTKSPKIAQVAQNMVIFEPAASQLVVDETIIVQNSSKLTFNNPATGGVQFYLPAGTDGQARVNVTGPGGMPLPRSAERTDETDVYKVTYPIKPGQTQFEISYVVPAGTPQTFRGRVVSLRGMPTSPLRLVAPAGVTITGKEIQILGTEPNTKATVYNVNAADGFAVDVAGIGTLHPPEATAGDTSDQPQIEEGKPAIYGHLGVLVGLTFAILATGLALLFRGSVPADSVPADSVPADSVPADSVPAGSVHAERH